MHLFIPSQYLLYFCLQFNLDFNIYKKLSLFLIQFKYLSNFLAVFVQNLRCKIQNTSIKYNIIYKILLKYFLYITIIEYNSIYLYYIDYMPIITNF